MFLNFNLLFKVDLYIDENLFVPTQDSFRVVQDVALTVIEGTEDTVFTLGACWHGKTKNYLIKFYSDIFI